MKNKKQKIVGSNKKYILAVSPT